jgi:hypothetical protein
LPWETWVLDKNGSVRKQDIIAQEIEAVLINAFNFFQAAPEKRNREDFRTID